MDFSEHTSAIAVFADELKQARVYLHIPLDEVAARTRIGLDYLQAIETGRWEEVPAAYLRGYVSAYAQCVSMNREKVMAQYDRMFAPARPNSPGAQLGSDPPLIGKPQYVELPRAKIRAEWFAALMRNRQLSYLLSGVLLIGMGTWLYWSKGRQRVEVPVSEFALSVTQAGSVLHTPNTRIWPDSSTMQSLHDGKRLKTAFFVAMAAADVHLQSPDFPPRSFRCSPYDTITLQYFTWVNVAARPAGSGFMLDGNEEVIRTTAVVGDTSFFAVGRVDSSVQNPVKDLPVDSATG